jgi:hypothetical protein
MASRPDELPDSIVLGQFTGIRNTVAPERLAPGDLEAAVNVDLDDTGQLRRRRGVTQVDDASYHSLRTIAGRVVGVKDGELGTIGANYAFTGLVSVGEDPLSYTAVGETIYFSSRSASGKIVDGVAQAWGQVGGEGQWLSPVVQPTETLGAIRGKLVGAPPLATEIEHYNGRIYLANDRWLWATELYLYDLVDKTRNFIPFEDPITMVRAVNDGCYVGTTRQLFFLSGLFAQGMKRTTVMDAPVIRGSAVSVPTANVHPAARTQPVPEGDSPVFLTRDGVCLGLDGGQVYNLTRGRVVFPGAVSAAALYREDQGANSYVAVTDSAGGPAANARIGDYVDAEVIRASQGG